MIDRPLLAPFARYRWDPVRGEHQLVYPEGLLRLNGTGAAIVRRCDGRSLDELLDELTSEFEDCSAGEVREFLQSLNARGLLRNASDS